MDTAEMGCMVIGFIFLIVCFVGWLLRTRSFRSLDMQQFSRPDERRLSTAFHFLLPYLLSMFRCMLCLRGGRGFAVSSCPLDQNVRTNSGAHFYLSGTRGLFPRCESGQDMKPVTRPHLVPKL